MLRSFRLEAGRSDALAAEGSDDPPRRVPLRGGSGSAKERAAPGDGVSAVHRRGSSRGRHEHVFPARRAKAIGPTHEVALPKVGRRNVLDPSEARISLEPRHPLRHGDDLGRGRIARDLGVAVASPTVESTRGCNRAPRVRAAVAMRTSVAKRHGGHEAWQVGHGAGPDDEPGSPGLETG
jgi:hypothetical protein